MLDVSSKGQSTKFALAVYDLHRLALETFYSTTVQTSMWSLSLLRCPVTNIFLYRTNAQKSLRKYISILYQKSNSKSLLSSGT
jgi:hypothetical protein